MPFLTIAEVQQGVVDLMADELRIAAERDVLLLLRAGLEDYEITVWRKVIDKEEN